MHLSKTARGRYDRMIAGGFSLGASVYFQGHDEYRVVQHAEIPMFSDNMYLEINLNTGFVGGRPRLTDNFEIELGIFDTPQEMLAAAKLLEYGYA